MDIYAPKDPDKIKEQEHVFHVDEITDEVTFIMRDDLEEHFTVVRQWIHKCDKCGKEMKRIKNPKSYARRYGLTCPKCGTKNTEDPMWHIDWD